MAMRRAKGVTELSKYLGLVSSMECMLPVQQGSSRGMGRKGKGAGEGVEEIVMSLPGVADRLAAEGGGTMRLVGVGMGLVVAVVEGELWVIMLDEAYSGLAWPGGKRLGGNVLLRLPRSKSAAAAAAFRKVASLNCTKLKCVSARRKQITHALKPQSIELREKVVLPPLDAIRSKDRTRFMSFLDWLAGLSIDASETALNEKSITLGILCDNLFPGIDEFAENEKQRGDVEIRTYGPFPESGPVTDLISEVGGRIDAGEMPWATLTVWGFRDSPVFKRGVEEICAVKSLGMRGQVGDPFITLLLLPDDECILFISPS